MTKRGRPRTWLNEEEFVKKYRLSIPVPSKCICGSLNFRFEKVGLDVCAGCNGCNATIIFESRRGRWIPWHPTIHPYWDDDFPDYE